MPLSEMREQLMKSPRSWAKVLHTQVVLFQKDFSKDVVLHCLIEECVEVSSGSDLPSWSA